MYIRTKDSVYDTNKYHYEIEIDVLYEIVWDDQYTEYGVNGKYSRGKVIAQSENLEELCDEFLYVNKPNEDYEKFEKPLIAIQNKFETMVKIAKITNSDLYGAIYTDKGLIYVAKLNEKGELELI